MIDRLLIELEKIQRTTSIVSDSEKELIESIDTVPVHVLEKSETFQTIDTVTEEMAEEIEDLTRYNDNVQEQYNRDIEKILDYLSRVQQKKSKKLDLEKFISLLDSEVIQMYQNFQKWTDKEY